MFKVLGSDGSYTHSSKATSFLIDDKIVIDAGNIIEGMGERCCEIEHIFITHTHFDHIVDLPFVLESYFECRKKPLKIYALQENLDILQKYLFNWSIWPNYLDILNDSGDASLQMIPIECSKTIEIDDIQITPIEANHTVPTCGFKVQKGEKSLVLSGDTYLNDLLTKLLNEDESITSLVVDVSFLSSEEEWAQKTKHLTPKLLQKLLKDVQRDDLSIYTYHQKPKYVEQIDKELSELGLLRNGGKRLERGDILKLF